MPQLTPTRRDVLALTTAALLSGSAMTLAAEPKGRILIVAGPSNHPQGTHEIPANGRLLKWGLDSVLKDSLAVEVVTAWPKDVAALDDVKSLVFVGDLFPAAVLPESERILGDLTRLMARGCGIVCLHFATGLEAKHVADDGDHPLLHWLGGYFATRCKHHQSIARVFPQATIEPAKTEHPITRGWKPFTLHDEPYLNNYFGKDGPAKSVTILATAELPPEKPKTEPVAWAVERADGGRGAAVVMPHFYRNWKNDDLRTLIFNGIFWSAKLDVPKEGVRVELPDLATFQPAAVEPVAKKK